MFKENDLVKIKPEWLERDESPDLIYLVVGEENDFGAVKISEEKDKALNSWENYTEKILNFISTIPNHIRIQFDTKFFEGPPPKDKETFLSEITVFNNSLNMLAADESYVVAEWSRFYQDREKTYDELLVGSTEKTALENFILEHLHPRFVYFSDYKKIYGNINLDEYIKEIQRQRDKGGQYQTRPNRTKDQKMSDAPARNQSNSSHNENRQQDDEITQLEINQF